jgi:hypothetical protein
MRNRTGEEHLLTAVATLGDVVGQMRNDDAGEAGHKWKMSG